jgi:TolB-like protein
LRFDRFTLDLTRGCLRMGEQGIDLRPKAFEVLCHLAENAGRLVPKQELHDTVWPNVVVSDDSLVQCIGELRQKLGDGEHHLIKTVSRRGYLLDVLISSSGVPTIQTAGAKASVEVEPSSTALPLPSGPSIAVLPFTNMSGDPEQEYFTDGVTEDIITALSRLRWFSVIAPNSTFVYEGQAVNAKQVGRELGVRYVLKGSVRRNGQRVRITGQLVDAIGGNHIWAERYDRELTDIFALQDEIAASVTAAIEPKLVAAEGMRIEKRSMDDLDAWDLVARALSHFWKLNALESAAAIAILRIAVQRHPNSAPAHSMLAFALVVSGYVGWIPRQPERELPERLVRRAVELDEEDPWAHAARGYLTLTDRRTDDAVRHFQTAIDLNPGFANAHGAAGWALVFDGRSEEALRCFDKAAQLNPRDPLIAFVFAGFAAAHYCNGRYLESIAWGRRVVQLRPGLLGGHRMLCASLAQAGHVEEAHSALNSLRRLQPNISIGWINQAMPYTTEPRQHFLDGLRKAGLSN